MVGTLVPRSLASTSRQFVGLIGLVVGLHQQFHGEWIVLIFFQMGDGFLEFFLIHQQRSGRTVVGTLNHAVAAARGHRFQLLQRLIGQRRISRVSRAHGAVTQDAGHFLILVGFGNLRCDVQERLRRSADISMQALSSV